MKTYLCLYIYIYIYIQKIITCRNEMIPTFDVTKIRNLKVIAKLKVGQKLSTRYQFYSIVSTDSYFIAPKRWFSGETRHNTVDSIQTLVMSCITRKPSFRRYKVRICGKTAISWRTRTTTTSKPLGTRYRIHKHYLVICI